MSAPGREEIINAVGSWGTLLEDRLKDDQVTHMVVAALAQGVGASLILMAEAKPDWHSDEMFAKAAVETTLKTLAERTEEIAEVATTLLATEFGPALEKSLAVEPDLRAAAARVGLNTPTGIAKLAHEYAAKQMRSLANEKVPVVLNLAREPWSVAALEEKLVGGRKKPFWRR